MTDSTERGDPRSIEILNKIKAAFAQKGFDGASMQDLARAAEMSAGNFYRYFPSKNAIVESMVELDLRDVGEIFRHILASEDVRGTFLAALRSELSKHREDCDGPLWAEIEAASIRRPEIAEINDRMEHEVRRHLIRTFALIGGMAEATASARFSAHAQLIIILFKGVAMQPKVDDDLIDLTLGTIDGLLTEIVSHGAADAAPKSVLARN